MKKLYGLTFIALVVWSFLAAELLFARAAYHAPGVEYQSHTGGGWLTFDVGFNASNVVWTDGLIVFEDFNQTGETIFGDLGFRIPRVF